MSTHIVYKTTNLVNGKVYIGVHSGGNPNYLGSGVALKAAIKKYGRENFVRETLRSFKTREEAFEYEKEVVDKDNPLSYNLWYGGYGCKKGREHHAVRNGSPFKGRKHSLVTRKKMSKSAKGACHNMLRNLAKVKRKPVIIDEVYYESYTQAAKCLGVSQPTISRRVKRQATKETLT